MTRSSTGHHFQVSPIWQHVSRITHTIATAKQTVLAARAPRKACLYGHCEGFEGPSPCPLGPCRTPTPERGRGLGVPGAFGPQPHVLQAEKVAQGFEVGTTCVDSLPEVVSKLIWKRSTRINSKAWPTGFRRLVARMSLCGLLSIMRVAPNSNGHLQYVADMSSTMISWNSLIRKLTFRLSQTTPLRSYSWKS